MNFDEYKITEEGASKYKVKGNANPLKGSVEENQSVFDRYPDRIREKFDTFVQKMSDRYGNIGEVTDLEKFNEGDGLYLVTFEGKKSLMLVSSGAKVIISADGSVYEYSSEENDFNLVSSLKTSEQCNNEDEFFKPFSVRGANTLFNEIQHNAKEIINLNVNKVDKEEGKGLSTNDFSNAYKTRVDNNTKNIAKKVDKENDKGLSTNDYTDEEQQQLKDNTTDIEKLNFYGTTDVYVLKEGVDIEVVDRKVVNLLKHDYTTEEYSQYSAIAFPEGITGIAFSEENKSLKANKVIFPKSLRTIGESFANSVNFDEQGNIEEDTVKIKVKEYVLNEGIEELENYAFADNVYLEQINIPNTLTKIGRGALQYCENLNKIIIPTAVTDIGAYNFMTYGDKKTTIHSYAGSYAETYAKENGIPFVNIGSDYSKQIATPDWNQSDETQPDYIKNKPIAGSILYVSIVDGVLSILQDSPKYTSSIIDNVLIVN